MSYLFDSVTRLWIERPAAGASLTDSWFRVPSTGCDAHWNFTNMGASLTDTVSGIVLAPNATYTNVKAGAWKGVPCVVTTNSGFLEGWDESLRHLGSITLEAVYLRRRSNVSGGYPNVHNIAICRGYYASEILEDNYLYAFGTENYGEEVRWDAEHDAGVGESFSAGPAACADRPTMIQVVRDGYDVRLYSDGNLVGATTLTYLPNGGTSASQTLCVGGDKEDVGKPGSMSANLFSLGITLSARTHADIVARYKASLGNYY